ncbi:hypothetical protein SDC9_210840 [bioreactor metagenome]|uniref:Uncharacterized protein n=1 Tax=bioreactor metagenome TaxID=1076179 RepID=A0A645JI29_9ZZZZ
MQNGHDLIVNDLGFIDGQDVLVFSVLSQNFGQVEVLNIPGDGRLCDLEPFFSQFFRQFFLCFNVFGGDDVKDLVQSFCFHPFPPNRYPALYILLSFVIHQNNRNRPGEQCGLCARNP